ncbi:TPA: extracellular solute-binding protein [Candidatus Avigastranaerophilus faecigallinarum]|nr:extracellular solute-binding protein [Candidatus Avigastranaerophilus faecigallinarum]
MKKTILLYILIFILFFVFILFSQRNNNDNDKTLITFWTLQLGTFDKYINNIISEYEKENQSVKIKWVDVPYSEGEKRTLAAILSDNPPDLINLTPDFSALLAQKKALYTINKEKLNQFLPSILESLKYQNEYFGIPFYATSAVTLYNKDLTNKKISTYDELFSILPKKNSYLTMFSFTENDTLLKLLNKYGINSYENINTDKSIYLFSQFKRMYDENIIPKECVTQTHRDALEKYMSGQLSYLVTGANFINMIKENAPSIYNSTGVIPQLVGDTNLYDFSLMNFVIPKKSKNPDSALDFAIYFTNKANQLELAKMTTVLPVNKDALNDNYFKFSKSTNIQDIARILSAKQLYNIQPSILNTNKKKDLNTLSANYIQEILINNKNIKYSLDKFSEDWQKL